MQEPQITQTHLPTENGSLIKPMTPLEFIRQIRSKALNVRDQNVEGVVFNQTFAGRVINIFERCQTLTDQKSVYPKLEFEGIINSNGLSKPSNKFITYHLPKAFVLNLYEDGKI